MRRFNVTGLCNPEQDYMVDIRKKSESKIEWHEVDGKRILEVNV